MDEGKKGEIKQWIKKGRNDLASAKRLLRGTHRLLDTGVYHCQQAAEKIIKSYLTYRDSPFRKVHDLGALVDQCMEIEKDFFRI